MARQIITKEGKAHIEVKDFINGRDLRAIQEVYAEHAEMEDGQLKRFKSKDSLSAIQDRLIDLIVISVNGETVDKIEKILDLPSKDYEQIIDEVQKVAQGTTAEKKTK